MLGMLVGQGDDNGAGSGAHLQHPFGDRVGGVEKRQHRLHQAFGFRSRGISTEGFTASSSDQNSRSSGNVGHRFTGDPPFDQGLEARQLIVAQGLVVVQIQIDASDAQRVGKQDLRFAAGTFDVMRFKIVGRPATSSSGVHTDRLGIGTFGMLKCLALVVGDQWIDHRVHVSPEEWFPVCTTSVRCDDR
jgi:hypothetical protein